MEHDVKKNDENNNSKKHRTLIEDKKEQDTIDFWIDIVGLFLMLIGIIIVICWDLF